MAESARVQRRWPRDREGTAAIEPQGIDIVGLDLSPHMLAVCRQRLRDEPQDVQSRVRLVEADMRRFDLGRAFTLVTIPFRPFRHLLTVEDQPGELLFVARKTGANP